MTLLPALLLVLAAVSLGAAGRRLSRALASELPAYGVGAVAGGLAVGAFVGAVAIVGRAFRDFDAGLAGAAALGVVAWALLRRLPSTSPAEAPSSGGERLRHGLGLAFVAALYAFVAWKYQMHDEHAIFGHKSMVEQLRRGAYPIYLPPLPHQDARYHYGFDLLAGALARAFGLSSDASIDLVTVGLALLISQAAAAVVSGLGARRAAPFAVVAIHLGAGLAWLLLAGVPGRHPRCLLQYHHPSCGVELFPTPFLNVFQHPVSLGVPLWLVALLLAWRLMEGGVEGRRRLALALGLLALLPGLAVGQLVYFVLSSLALVAAIGAQLLWPPRGAERRAIAGRGAVLGLVLALGLGLAWLAGGMLTPSPVTDPNLVVRRAALGFPPGEGPGGVLWHHAVNLGLGFVLLPWFAILALRRRSLGALALLAFAVGGMLVPHGWNYVRSWDIVKFPSASAFALTLLVVAWVDAPLLGPGLLRAWLRRGTRALLLGSGVVAACFVAVPLAPEHKLYDDTPWALDPLVGQTIDWWRSRPYDRQELILAQSNVAPILSVFGGLSVVGGDYDFQALGIRGEILGRQRLLQARARASLDEDALDALGVRWLMYSVEELDNLGPAARARLEAPSGRLSLAASFPDDSPRRTRRIWRLEPPTAR